MKRYKSILIFAALLFAGFAPHAYAEEITPQFPITVDPDKSEVHYFDVYHGETVLFEVTFKRPSNETMTFFWQEQGMGDSYWSESCTTVGDGVYRAVFTPQMDTGAKVFNCFIGRPGMIYRAVFQLRMKQSPGALPNALPLPTPVIDFARIHVLNPPWGSGGGGCDSNAVAAISNRVDSLETAADSLASSVSGLASSVSGLQSSKAEINGNVSQDFGANNIQAYGHVSVSGDVIAGGDVRSGSASLVDAADMAQQAYSAAAQALQDVAPLAADIRSAYQYSKTIALYMTGNTNAWFAGTNYVFGSDAATRRRFAWEPGMDAATVPCSMALWEIRDGVRQCVWDQRDWTAWYWSFKAQQMRGEIAATNKLIYAAINEAVTNDSNHAWAKRYASTGRRNPDASTTFVDTPSVTLSPGMSWETVATVGGCGYWTIVGNGAVIGGSGTNATLNIKDFEGNSILEITKGQHMLAWLDSSDIVGQLTDADGWVCFDMMADVKPTGYFSTTLVAADFVAETDENCPAQCRWEDLGGHVWRVHFLLKPGIVSGACFAKFQVEVEGKTQIRYNADTVINGGLIFEGVKIAPVIQSGAAVGSTVTWKVVK